MKLFMHFNVCAFDDILLSLRTFFHPVSYTHLTLPTKLEV